MKVKLEFLQDIYNTHTYSLSDSDIQDYIAWCEQSDLEAINKHNLIDFLETCCSYDEDIDVENSVVCNHEGLNTIFDEIEKIYANK